MNRPVLSVMALAALVASPFASANAQSMMDQMILQRCSAAMQSDFDKAGQTPAPGLIEKTCSCVVKQVNVTHNIDVAKSICTKQALSGP